MCRLLGQVSPEPASFADVLGEDQCEMFQFMARLHDDGWGAMWLDETSEPQAATDTVTRIRVPGAGHDDGQLRATLQDMRHRAVVAHLRLATRSMSLLDRNTHPFLADGVGMAHNGAIVPTSMLRAMLEPDLLATVEGDTDSELYFALIRQFVARGYSWTDAVAHAVGAIRGPYPRPSLNAMVLTPRELIVVHASSQAPVPYEDFTASAIADQLPMHHDEAYFRMSFRRFPSGALAFASAGLDTTGWQALPENSITRVDVQTLELRTEQILAVSP